MITINDLLKAFNATTLKLRGLFKNIDTIIPQVKEQLENALNGNLDQTVAKDLINQLENVKGDIEKGNQQLLSVNPLTKTPKEGEITIDKEPEVIAEEIDNGEEEIEDIEAEDNDNIGLPDAPVLNLTQ